MDNTSNQKGWRYYFASLFGYYSQSRIEDIFDSPKNISFSQDDSTAHAIEQSTLSEPDTVQFPLLFLTFDSTIRAFQTRIAA